MDFKEHDVPMTLEEAQQTLWIHQQDTPKTTQEALARASQAMIECIGAFQNDELIMVQTRLEDTLVQILMVMKTLNVSPDCALERAITRGVQTTVQQQRAFHIYGDRVDIQVGGELRGGWPLYTHEDYEAVVALARTFGCEVTHHDSQQLALFKATSSSRTGPTIRNRVPNYYTNPSSKKANASTPRPQFTLVSNDCSS